MKYARISNTYAVDVRTDSPEGCYTPNVVAEFVEVPDDVQDGWILNNGNWSKPIEQSPTEKEIADAHAALLEQQTNELAALIRTDRNEKLKNSDWTQLVDATADKAAWATYRQSLRDITDTKGFPWTITWPIAPNLNNLDNK